MIPYGRQNVNQDDVDAVVEVLRSEYLTQGPVVPAFERNMASYCGVSHAIATNSATSALHIACLALDVGPGDVVWTSPITFVASANCARYCGADVDFVDIDPKTYNMSIEKLAEKLEQAAVKKCLPKVIIPVHLAGQSCEMEAIYKLSLQYGFRIVEDASHAVGGHYQNEKIGCCRYSDVTVFSFHPVKIITTGEGGMALTNQSTLAKRMARLRSHGVTRDVSEMTHSPDGSWYYQQIDLGYNYRMSDIQAALGISQFKRLDEFVVKRNALASRYKELLENTHIICPWQHPEVNSAWHLYIVRLSDTAKTNMTRLEVFEGMRLAGIGVNLHYIPLYRQPYYASRGYDPLTYPESEAYYKQAISLPLFPGLTDGQQDEVVSRLSQPVGYQTIF